MTIIDGFRPFRIELEDIAITGALGGSGPPLLLLHGYPQTQAMWRKRAADVRGYAVPGGHFLPEEAPEETYTALREFFIPH
jgi:hypothetical protein